jgi:DNA-directed RNA polymerase specialized sigma24 family protein
MQLSGHSSRTQAREGPVPEFEAFFEDHSLKVFGAMCLISGNRQEAEQITQDAFLRVWERWDRVSKLDDPVGFLFRTAMNLFRDRARRATLAARRTLGPPTEQMTSRRSRIATSS